MNRFGISQDAARAALNEQQAAIRLGHPVPLWAVADLVAAGWSEREIEAGERE